MVWGWFKNFKEKRNVCEIEKNPIYSIAMASAAETLNNKSHGLGKHASDNFKKDLIKNLPEAIIKIVLSENPIMANREAFAGNLIMTAKYQVLVLPDENEPEEDVTGLREKLGISGKLKKHIKEIAEKDEEIKKLAWGMDNPNEVDLYEACLFRYWTYHFWTSVYNTIRLQLNDFHADPEKDWYRPFFEKMCAWEEQQFREKIGQEDILDDSTPAGRLRGLKYSTFMNIVLNGHKYPNLEWEEHYKGDSEG